MTAFDPDNSGYYDPTDLTDLQIREEVRAATEEPDLFDEENRDGEIDDLDLFALWGE